MSNTTRTNTTEWPTVSIMLLSKDERYATVAAIMFIAAASLVGNTLVCCAFFTNDKKGSSMTVAGLHLAVANLLITIFWGPTTTFYLYVEGEWTLGPEMCKLVAVMQNAGVVASLLHLLMVTVEKYLAVCLPFKFRSFKNRQTYRYLTLLVWLISGGESIFYMQFKTEENIGGKQLCIEIWPDQETFTIVTLSKTLFFFLTLFSIMIFLGMTIFSLRFGKGNFRPDASRREEVPWRRKRSRQARAVKILVVTLVSVLVCWTPLHSLSFVAIAKGMGGISMRDQQIIFTVSLVAFFSVCTIHPIIFLFFNRQGKEFVETNLRRFSFSTRESLRRPRTPSEDMSPTMKEPRKQDTNC